MSAEAARAAVEAGAALFARHDADGALRAWRRAIAVDGRCVPAYLNIAKVLEDRGARSEALAEYRRVLALEPQLARALCGVARLAVNLGELDEAFGACERLAAQGGEDARWATATKAWILERRGAVHEAHALVRPLAQAAGVDVHVATVFAKVCERLVPPSDEALAPLEALASRADLSDADRAQTLRALAQLCDVLGRHDAAFAHLEAAKALEPDPASRRRVAQVRAVTAASIAAYVPERMARVPRADHGSELPVFVVGMPRSGTTLAEQILASHPRAFGAGELSLLPRIATESLPQAAPYPRCLDDLTLGRANGLARAYLNELRALAPQAERVVDKMMSNYQHLGLVQVLFPKARVVHCVRDPLDTCLSIYFHELPSVIENRDLASLGRAYREYRERMARWERLLELRIFTLRYETLIAEPERTVRELVAFCGLEWDERCLKFYDNPRVVRTYSYHQVRKPLYRSSIGRYRAYERHLGPLKEALGEALEPR